MKCVSFEIWRSEKELCDCKDLGIILLLSFLPNNENVLILSVQFRLLLWYYGVWMCFLCAEKLVKIWTPVILCRWVLNSFFKKLKLLFLSTWEVIKNLTKFEVLYPGCIFCFKSVKKQKNQEYIKSFKDVWLYFQKAKASMAWK